MKLTVVVEVAQYYIYMYIHIYLRRKAGTHTCTHLHTHTSKRCCHEVVLASHAIVNNGLLSNAKVRA